LSVPILVSMTLPGQGAWHAPDTDGWLLCTRAGTCSVIAWIGIMGGYRRASPARLAPRHLGDGSTEKHSPDRSSSRRDLSNISGSESRDLRCRHLKGCGHAVEEIDFQNTDVRVAAEYICKCMHGVDTVLVGHLATHASKILA